MKILIIECGTRYIKKNGVVYAESNMNNETLEMYNELSNEIFVFGRADQSSDVEKKETSKFNRMSSKYKFYIEDDLYKNVFEYFNIHKRKKIKEHLNKLILDADLIIIKSVTNYYSYIAAELCKKLCKKYIIIVTGFAFETQWFRKGISGKVMSFKTEKNQKKAVKEAPYVIYVTESELQKRYKTKGKYIGCSDIKINIEEEIELKRINHIQKSDKIVIGTIGNLNTDLKGQIYVIKALKEIQNNVKYEYRLLGRGKNKKIKKYIEKNNIKNVIFDGSKPHEEVEKWLDKIDIYIQPSFSEGLCRSIIEAMSRGCTVMASNVGGNKELIEERYLFKKKSSREIAKMIKGINKKQMTENVNKNIKKAESYYYASNKKIKFIKQILKGEI